MSSGSLHEDTAFWWTTFTLEQSHTHCYPNFVMTTTTTEMNDPTSISLTTDFSGSIDCTGSDIDDIALSSEIQNESVSSFMEEFMRGNDDLPWTRLMEWFVEAAIGVELFRKHNRSAPPLSFENIRIDRSSTILIGQEQHSNVGSLASDFSTISSFFLDIHRTLDQTKRLILPLDHSIDAVCSRIMVALLEHFVASGDLILPHSSPHDYFQYFLDVYHHHIKQSPHTLFYLTKPLAHLFCLSVLSPSSRSHFVPTPHSFLRGSDVVKSEQLLNAVDKVKETRSLDVVRNLHFDWEEWVTMMEMVEKGVTSLVCLRCPFIVLQADLSFLQSRCFRQTLEALQAKHQNRAKPPQNEESSRAESSSGDLNSEQFPMPFRFKGSQFTSSTISTEVQLPSHYSSSSTDIQFLSSLQPHQLNQRHSRDVPSIFSREVLTVIHSLLSKPQIDSFPWKLRSNLTPETELELLFIPSNVPVSLNERFDPSMFDETDDSKMFQSLTRCLDVIKTTQSLQCIDDLDCFTALLIAGLHNSSQIIASFCLEIFIQTTEYLPSLDPRDDQFRTLRSAFRDGTQIEQRALLNLWRVWFRLRLTCQFGPKMASPDFDFVGFLAADMTDTPFFDEACRFVLFVFSSGDVSMTEQWKSDFLLQFEKKHHILDRLAAKPGPWSNAMQSTLTLTRSHIFIAAALSLLHGYNFPSALTALITIDLNSSPHLFDKRLNPTFFLNHTSIAPKHRHSFDHRRHLSSFLLHSVPAIVSAAFEFFHRFVSVVSDAIRMKLVRFGLLDDVGFAVSCSSFLEDYEKGIVVIGILLDTIRRDHLKRRMRTIEQASQSFLYLVNFVKEGKYLNAKDTRQASTFLESITPHYGSSFSTDQILFELVPAIDGSCSGFTESIVPLLTSSNEELSKSALLLLNEIVFDVTQSSRFDFLEAGFFGLLPTAFYEQKRHLLDTSSLYLMNILYGFMFWSRPDVAGRICQLSHISMDIFQLTFIDKFFRPIGPFLDFICRNLHQITDSANSRDVSLLFGSILKHSPFLEEMAQFMLSSSFSLAFSDCLHFFETANATVNLLRSVMEGVRAWEKDTPAVRKRGHQIVAKLCEEGLSDEIDMLFQRCDVVFAEHRFVSVGPSSPTIVPNHRPQPSSPAIVPNHRPQPSSPAIVPSHRLHPSSSPTEPRPGTIRSASFLVPPLVLNFFSADPPKIELLRTTIPPTTFTAPMLVLTYSGSFTQYHFTLLD
ncbi:hypothetical protein BLNAU_16431 [Blattamonas nauphoetae]|uniref:Uncharacterized protein n=1 Tax=Blattamonas nauphoetae TaxID=2049346 RepID=A0ABQ9XD81_9EUKA|nr:hypothetical protein BLNAU_16431 [Blattamonas nauphoetae]